MSRELIVSMQVYVFIELEDEEVLDNLVTALTVSYPPKLPIVKNSKVIDYEIVKIFHPKFPK